MVTLRCQNDDCLVVVSRSILSDFFKMEYEDVAMAPEKFHFSHEKEWFYRELTIEY